MTASNWAEVSPQEGFEKIPAEDRLQYAHNTATGEAFRHMDTKSDKLPCITSKLQHLEIDFTNAYCPVGCCRMIDINADFLPGLEPAILRVLGVREGEEEQLRDGLLTWPLEFNPKDNPWARYAN
ncbi:hypothetical protein BKA63DRAFT_560653 [Paraphoma chrysanthemicola]|nr:hypothetical protein BKA63DRAFT_560653 [Paraphoma chrysanthemicola]